MAEEISPYMQAHDMGEAIQSGQIAINWGGHYCSGSSGKTPKCHDIGYVTTKVGSAIRMTLQDDQIAALYAAWKSGVPLAEPVTVGPDYVEDCWHCGNDFGIETDGVTWQATKCPCPDGIGPIVFELNVPSGNMVVANDLRDLFPVLSDHNVNQPHGILLTTQDYAKIGVAHCCVGNSCPAMYECRDGRRAADSHFVIGTTSSRGKAPRFHSDDRVHRVAGICTDLWWYSICDADEFVKRAGKPLEEALKEHDATLVPCVPGVYQFRHVHHLLREKADNFAQPHVFTYIKRKRKPDPLVDYMAAYRNLHLTAEQVIADKLIHWPSLYAERYDFEARKKVQLPADEQYAKGANSLLMVIGAGNNYHPNGFWGGESWMTADSPAVEVVTLDKPYNWYPGSENYCALSHIAGLSERVKPDLVVNDSFIALAFNVCRCILTHGVQDYQPENQSHAKNTFAFAKKCMTALKKKYPDKIPANCVNIVETKTPYVFKALK